MIRSAALYLMIISLPLAALDEIDVGLQPLPPEGPVRRLQPLLPRPSVGHIDKEQHLVEQLSMTLDMLDRDIKGILARYDGLRPANLVQQFPELEDQRRKRDLSWEDLQRVLLEEEKKQSRQDILDVPGSKRGQDLVERRLLAQNQLAIVKCYYELATGGNELDAGSLQEGREIVATIPVEDLPLGDRPFVYYYRFALTLESSRAAQGERAESLRQEARRYRDELAREFPDSYLTGTADSLLSNSRLRLPKADSQ